MKSKKKVLLLISGGIDSPVAGNLLQDNGFEVIGIHFSQTPFTDDSPEKKSILACKKLGISKMIVCQAGKAFQELASKCYHDHYFVLMKRMMLRVSSDVGLKMNVSFLATGEAIGQVSSQTIENLFVIDNASKLNVLRPLLAYDKNDIINIAREIETYEISKGPEVCDVLGPKHPKTKTEIDKVLREEEKVDVNGLVNEMVADAREIDVEKANVSLDLNGSCGVACKK